MTAAAGSGPSLQLRGFGTIPPSHRACRLFPSNRPPVGPKKAPLIIWRGCDSVVCASKGERAPVGFALNRVKDGLCTNAAAPDQKGTKAEQQQQQQQHPPFINLINLPVDHPDKFRDGRDCETPTKMATCGDTTMTVILQELSCTVS